MALEAGFRTFDTAEAPYWYDQTAVGEALHSFIQLLPECEDIPTACVEENLMISTKIPPWELTSIENIRNQARQSQETLLGFCSVGDTRYPLDAYFIHAPQCWRGWHPYCQTGNEATLSLRDAWLAMEQVVTIDKSARRIGLSNVSPGELLDIIQFAKSRTNGRIPDVLQAYADPLRPATELRRICAEHGIEFLSYSTLGTQHAMQGKGNPVLTNPLIVDLAEYYQRSTAEVVLSWAIQRGMSVIPRSSKRTHIMELANLIYSPPFLEEGHLEAIDMLAQ
eukprot:CAMPEP_0116013796 /NCGR_PEP_ID=MMETSP0321-20121206/5927_1 /TAXON_ID=163516 /ORGANISM="Leptocylindrus danicus var. danicus, Strain B650" /LENGTH=279 /DNA_ID=CAMNT_0003483389 /DNA_START=132 /DNA_END=971 /DNA_ORIENTATION=-